MQCSFPASVLMLASAGSPYICAGEGAFRDDPERELWQGQD